VYLAKLVNKAVAELFQPNNKYVRPMVCLSELRPARYHQGDLLTPEQGARSMLLMKMLDHLNSKHTNNVFLASTGIKHHWAMARNMKSNNFTPRWRELPKVKC
jgi:DNA polymerase V